MNHGLTALFALIFSLLSPRAEAAGPSAPQAHQGVLDLTGWDFSRDGMVELGGQWQFSWLQLRSPAEIEKSPLAGWEFTEVPGLWVHCQPQESAWPGSGFATYRLSVQIPDSTHLLGLYIPELLSSYRLWIDGRLAAANGVIGTDAKSAAPRLQPCVVPFAPRGSRVTLVLQIANFSHPQGGAIRALKLGTAMAVMRLHENQRTLEIFIIGILLIIGLFHLIIFLIGKKDPAPLYFGLFCLLAADVVLLGGGRFFAEMFPGFDWAIGLRLELVAGAVAMLILLRFMEATFPLESSRKASVTFQVGLLAFGLALLVLPLSVLLSGRFVSHAMLIAVSIYCLWVSVRAALTRRYGAWVLVAGIAALIFALVNFALAGRMVLGADHLAGAGLLAFVFLIELSLNVKFMRTEDDLRRSEEKNNALLHAIPDAMLQVDRDLTVLDAKLTAHTTRCLTRKSFDQGVKVADLIPADLGERFLQALRQVMRSGAARIFEHAVETGGQRVHYEIRIVKSGAEQALTIIRDITEQKEIEHKMRRHEERLIHADKLVALGTLVAGVAHEINNPNNSILLSVEIHEEAWRSILPILDEYAKIHGDFQIRGFRYSELREEMNDSFTRVIRNSRRIKRIVEDLKTFAREDTVPINEDVDINGVVDSSIRLVENQIKKSTNHFTVEYGKGIPIVKGHFQRLEQVVINLIQNACQALGDKEKKLTVTTEFSKEQNLISIAVADEGCGMDAETQKMAFDPFFTTKQKLGGIGLGLSISSGIIKDHHGTLEIESEPGKGTTARVLLPPCEPNPKSPKEYLIHGSQTVSGAAGPLGR
jgi:signal transduction histidine kinase